MPGIRIPFLRLHKASGQAVVTVRRRDIYCGKFGSPEADRAYRQILASLVANGPETVGLQPRSGSRSRPATSAVHQLTVNELLLAYDDHAQTKYPPPSRELEAIRPVIRAVRELFGEKPAADLGPLDLRTIRQSWINAGLARPTINKKTRRVIEIWDFAHEFELLPETCLGRLKTVKTLRERQSSAKEGKTVRAVPIADYLATLPHVLPPVRAMLQLLFLTGARTGEIRCLRNGDVDRDQTPWRYSPKRHKTAHRGHERAIFFGPKAREVLAPWLDETAPDDFVFSPAKAVRKLRDSLKRDRRSDRRRTKAAASKRRQAQRERIAKGGKATPRSRRLPGDNYRRHSIGNAVRRACRDHAIPSWHPHQLRHACKDRLCAIAGLEAWRAIKGESAVSEEAQRTLGHARISTTARYGTVNFNIAAQPMEQYG